MLEDLDAAIDTLASAYLDYKVARTAWDKQGSAASYNPVEMRVYHTYTEARDAYKEAHARYKSEFRIANEYKRL